VKLKVQRKSTATNHFTMQYIGLTLVEPFHNIKIDQIASNKTDTCNYV